MNKKRRRIVLWVVIVAVVAAFAFLVICNVSAKRNRAPEVTVTELKRGSLISTVTATGELRSANQVEISAEMVARVRRLLVKEGQGVRKGQLLCVLDDVALVSSRDLARANFDEAVAAYKRGQALYTDSLISPAEFERLRTTFEVARAQLEQSEDKLDKTRIYAPISGRIVSLNVEEGETVMMGTMNNAGTVMMTIADLDVMQAKVNVDESDVVNVRIGQKVKVKLDALPDTSFSAEVTTVGYMPTTSIASEAEGVTDFEVILTLSEIDQSQRPGMSVTADITTAIRDNVITCPIQAIGRREIEGKSRETVFVLDKGRVKLVPITTGISDGQMIEVTSGLNGGEEVITGPYKSLRTLREGDVVKVKKEEPEWQQNTNSPRVRVRVQAQGR